MRIKLSSSFLCAAFFLLSAANLPGQDLGPHFKNIKEGIFVRAEKPLDSNAAIILTEEGVVLIDSGHNPPDSHALMKAVKQLTQQPVRFLINTEPHGDHTTGHFVFSPPAVIVAHEGATVTWLPVPKPQAGSSTTCCRACTSAVAPSRSR